MSLVSKTYNPNAETGVPNLQSSGTPTDLPIEIEPSRVKGRWRGLAALAVGSVGDGQEYMVLNSLFPTIRDVLGLNYTALGTFNAINELTKIVMPPLWAVAGTRWNRKAILVWFTGFWGIWTVLAGFSNSFVMLAVLFALAMLGSAASGGITPAVISDLFSDGERSKAFGIAAGFATIAAIVITPTFALFSGIEGGWRYGFFMIGGVSILSGLLIWAWLDDPGKGGSEHELANVDEAVRDQAGLSLGELPALFKISSFVRYVIPYIFDMGRLVFSFLVVYLVDVLELSNASAVVLLVPVIAGGMIGAFGGAFLMERIHRRFPQTGRVKAMAVTLFVGFVASVLGTQFAYATVTPYVVAFAVWGLTKGVKQAAHNPILHAFLLPEQRGAASSLNESMRGVSSLLLGLLLGLLSDQYGLQVVFGAMLVGTTFIQFVLFLFILPTYQRDVARLHSQLTERGQEWGKRV